MSSSGSGGALSEGSTTQASSVTATARRGAVSFPVERREASSSVAKTSSFEPCGCEEEEEGDGDWPSTNSATISLFSVQPEVLSPFEAAIALSSFTLMADSASADSDWRSEADGGGASTSECSPPPASAAAAAADDAASSLSFVSSDSARRTLIP